MARQLWREKLETTIQNAGMFDLRDWLRAGERIGGLDRADKVAREKLTGHPIQDTFFSLVKSDPRVAQDLKPGLQPLGDLLSKAIDTPNFQQLHEACRGDVVAAGMAANEFFNGFVKNLPPEITEQAQEARKAQHTADQSQNQADAARAASEAYNDQADTLSGESREEKTAQEALDQAAGEPTPEGAAHGTTADLLEKQVGRALAEADRLEELAQALEELGTDQEAKAKAHAQQAQVAIDYNEARVIHEANLQAQAADKKTKEAMTFIKGFSQAAGGDPQNLDPEALQYGMRLFSQFPQVSDFAKILGWTKRVAKAEYRNSAQGRTEFKGYKVGELDLAHMAAHEWVAFSGGRNMGRQDWIRRVADGEISHNDYEGKEEQGRGPIVWVSDQSGSMSGEPALLSKAIEWALIDIARADGRDFRSIAFAGEDNYVHWKAPAKPDYEGLFNHMQGFLGGGTEPYKPLRSALNIIEAGDLKADIVLITDGIFATPPVHFVEELENAKERRPLRIETVLLDVGQWESHQASEFSDRITNLSSFVKDKGKIRDILKAVV